jgi:hypothetical protein
MWLLLSLGGHGLKRHLESRRLLGCVLYVVYGNASGFAIRFNPVWKRR